ncbi:MAG: ABC transporter permease [Burkholderiales bacterium]|nr:ABC transporter permease [Burkholderiales bacterium]
MPIRADTANARDVFGAVALTKRRRNLLALVSIAGLLMLWWLVTALAWVDKVLLPAPAEVLSAFMRSASDGSLAKHVGISLLRVVEGFAIALAVAVPIGILMGSFAIARGLIEPVVELLRPIPPIAVIPLAILWFGIEELSKVLIIAYGAFFPILVNTIAGFHEVDRTHIRAAQALGASRLQIFRDVVLRSAYPFIVVGARLGMGMAFIVLVAAELIASDAGLGYLINDGRYNFHTDQIFLGMACIGVLGFLLNRALLEAERHLLKWKYVGQ